MGLFVILIVLAFPLGRLLVAAFFSLIALALANALPELRGVGTWIALGPLTLVIYSVLTHLLRRADQKATASI
jgi:hypothetical protein